MSGNHKTVSGIVPAENNEELYIESTAKAEAFIQKKFDVIIQLMNKDIEKENAENPDKDPIPLQEPVEVNLMTARMSSKFYPFVLVLPECVLTDKASRRRNDELGIFNPQHTERNANIKKPLYDIIYPFMYDENDKKSFFSQTLQHELKISSRTAGNLKAHCRLKIHTFDKGRTTYVAVYLDPLRVFHNMAEYTDSSIPFRIHITHVEQIKGGNYKYKFVRANKVGAGKNKKGIDFERQVFQAVTGRN